MSGRIYLVGDGDGLVPLEEQTYEAEAVLQGLLADHPYLLAGEQVSPSSPRRWLLVSREIGVPGEPHGANKWSLDHLFIDQDGIPTLAEVKRSTNTQIRREVVGQLLDYAANGSVYWSLEQIVASYVRRCEKEGVDPDDELLMFLDDETDPDAFWQGVKTNLQAGRIRLVFVADAIPTELRRIIEFLNVQMDPAEILGLEVHQYVGEAGTVLVPRVVGLTAEAEKTKAIASSIQWTRDTFLHHLSGARGEAETDVAQRILDWCDDSGLNMKWGKGAKNGSASPKLHRDGIVYNLMTVWTDGGVAIQFSSMRHPPFNDPSRRRDLGNRLATIHPSFSFSDTQLEGPWPYIRLHQLTNQGRLQQFLATWDWYIEQLPN